MTVINGLCSCSGCECGLEVMAPAELMCKKYIAILLIIHLFCLVEFDSKNPRSCKIQIITHEVLLVSVCKAEDSVKSLCQAMQDFVNVVPLCSLCTNSVRFNRVIQLLPNQPF